MIFILIFMLRMNKYVNAAKARPNYILNIV